MKVTNHRFELGDFECVAVADGSHDYPLKSFFANVPLAQVEAALRRRDQPIDVITTPYTYLVVDTGEHRVLVDMGAGKLGPKTGHLADNLRAADITPESIDTVVITHAHPDHIGGALDDQGRPMYPNAQVYLWKGEWEFWTSERAFAKAPKHFVEAARHSLMPLQDRLHLVDEEGDVVPGIGVLAAPGHTPGHIVVSVSSGTARLLYTSDVVLHPLHLEHPAWTPVYDVMPEQAAASKRRIFDLAAKEGVLVQGQHFHPFPSVGKVEKTSNGWRWQPIRIPQVVA